jgi:hypothetical protein
MANSQWVRECDNEGCGEVGSAIKGVSFAWDSGSLIRFYSRCLITVPNVSVVAHDKKWLAPSFFEQRDIRVCVRNTATGRTLKFRV